jgi:hypothetical protein
LLRKRRGSRLASGETIPTLSGGNRFPAFRWHAANTLKRWFVFKRWEPFPPGNHQLGNFQQWKP